MCVKVAVTEGVGRTVPLEGCCDRGVVGLCEECRARGAAPSGGVCAWPLGPSRLGAPPCLWGCTWLRWLRWLHWLRWLRSALPSGPVMGPGARVHTPRRWSPRCARPCLGVAPGCARCARCSTRITGRTRARAPGARVHTPCPWPPTRAHLCLGLLLAALAALAALGAQPAHLGRTWNLVELGP